MKGGKGRGRHGSPLQASPSVDPTTVARRIDFHGNTEVILTHGFTKEKKVPDKEIERALDLKRKFGADPEFHTFVWEP